jgi:hypothetical protein
LHPNSHKGFWEVLEKLNAEVAQLVEHNLAKVGVARSNRVFRSKKISRIRKVPASGFFLKLYLPPAALVVELVDTQDLKSCSPQREYGFDSRLGHKRPSF